MRLGVAVSFACIGACGCAQIADPDGWFASSGLSSGQGEVYWSGTSPV